MHTLVCVQRALLCEPLAALVTLEGPFTRVCAHVDLRTQKGKIILVFFFNCFKNFGPFLTLAHFELSLWKILYGKVLTGIVNHPKSDGFFFLSFQLFHCFVLL